MRPIGGYFELELRKNSEFPHSGGILVNSGRNAFEYIIRVVEKQPDVVWLPYYTCDVMLQPLRHLDIRYDFYHINESLEVADWPLLGDNDYIVVNNYFGIKDKYIESLSTILELTDKLIIDNSQAWYAKDYPMIRQFYSPRKFFGVPDGGVALTPEQNHLKLTKSESCHLCDHLLKRIESGPQSGYKDFHSNEKELDGQPLKEMSNLTAALLQNVDFDEVKVKRRSNYEYLAYHLNKKNRLNLPDFNSFECPMVYPYYTEDAGLRQRLIDNKIYVATYWPAVFERSYESSIEYQLAQKLIPMPIDQRYGEKEMNRIVLTLTQKA